MTNQKSVWVVEQGSYSDYRVVGVFSTEENAQQVAAAVNTPEEDKWGDGATVSEWPLDPAVDELRQGFAMYSVHMLEDGTTEKVEREAVHGYGITGSLVMWRRSTARAYRGKDAKDLLDATVWAKDEDHAIKIANEHRTRMIATGEWYADKEAE